MKTLRFFINHSIRDMLRNRQRTLFALFCVAVGVAAVVSLRMLGLMISDALTTNVAAINHGDISLYATGRSSLGEETPDGRYGFTEDAAADIRAWAAENGYPVNAAITSNDIQVAAIGDDGEPTRPGYVRVLFVEPETYPFYTDAAAIDPPGAPLAELLDSPEDIVIADNLAARLGLGVGDQLFVSGSEDYFTISGIIPTETENPMENVMTMLFGYVYLNIDQAPQVGIAPNLSRIYLQLPPDADITAVDRELRTEFPRIGSRTRVELLEDFEMISNVIGDFILIMGVAAMVVGGVGIINTMLVVVSRRTVEIAVLKTLGMKGNQVTLLFLVEAILYGLVGSLLGVVLGIGMSFIAKYVGELFLQQPLRWRLTLDPVLVGIGMGVVVTTIFGFLPTLTAAKVRPAAVLRPADALLPRAGLLRRIFALIVLTFTLGLIGMQIVGNFWAGQIIAVIGVVTLGVLLGIFWMLVWIIARLPAFGNVDLKLALRGISTNRSRTASALLSLTGGVYALSIITLMSTTMIQVLNFSLSEQLGGNVIAMSFLPGANTTAANALREIDGVTYSQVGNYRAELVAINDITNVETYTEEQLGRLRARILEGTTSVILAQDVSNNALFAAGIVEGRGLTPDDSGQPVIVVPGTPEIYDLGIQPGDELTFRLRSYIRSQEVTFTVIGISEIQIASMDINAANGLLVPMDSIPGNFPAETYLTIADAGEDTIDETLIALGGLPGTMAYDISAISSAFERLLDQMIAIPLLVAGIALFAGTTIIANTVSLATLERRREIGIMKAVGVKGRRVLGLLLLENGIVGLVGGLVGVGVSALVIRVFTWLSDSGDVFMQTITGGQVLILVSMSVLIALFATILTAWGASREKPMNVLRYE